jgi:hypothetical protein
MLLQLPMILLRLLDGSVGGQTALMFNSNQLIFLTAQLMSSRNFLVWSTTWALAYRFQVQESSYVGQYYV